MSKVIITDKAPAAIGPYVQGRNFGGLMITSGQLPINPATGKMPEDVRDQARQSLANVKAILEEAGYGMTDVQKTTVFVKDLNDFAIVNEVYADVFGASFPARSCVEVARLPMDAKVEIEVMAWKA